MKFLILGQLREFKDSSPPTLNATMSIQQNRDEFVIEADEIIVDASVVKFLSNRKEGKYGADLVASVPNSYLVIRDDVRKGQETKAQKA